MPYSSKIILLLGIVCLTACEVEEFAPSSPDQVIPEVADQPEVSEMLRLVNQLRQAGCRCGSANMPAVAPLTTHADLDAAASRHAADMQRNDFFDHSGSDGTDVADRLSDTGYRWQTVGENIAWGYRDVQSVFEGWRDSPGHCRNLMNANFSHLGSARAGQYWVQTFARPRTF